MRATRQAAARPVDILDCLGRRPEGERAETIGSLSRSIGNRRVSRMLAACVLMRALPESTEGWSTEVEKIGVESAGAWVALLQRLDQRKYSLGVAGDQEVVDVNGQISLHPRKLVELWREGLLTRVLSRIPAPGADPTDDFAYVLEEYGLKPNPAAGLAAQVGETAFGPDDILTSASAKQKARAVLYATWVAEKIGKLAATKAQLANHAQFFLETADASRIKDEGQAFDEVYARYRDLQQGQAKSLPGTAPYPEVKLAGPVDVVVAEVRKIADKINFTSDSAALYHAVKHHKDFFPPEKTAARVGPASVIKPHVDRVDVDAYLGRAREIVRDAPRWRSRAAQHDTGHRLEFERAGAIAVVNVRQDGSVVLSTAYPGAAAPGDGEAAQGDLRFRLGRVPADAEATTRLKAVLKFCCEQALFSEIAPDTDVLCSKAGAPGLLIVTLEDPARVIEVSVQLAERTAISETGTQLTDDMRSSAARVLGRRTIAGGRTLSADIRLNRVEETGKEAPPFRPEEISKDNVLEALRGLTRFIVAGHDEDPPGTALLEELTRLKLKERTLYEEAGLGSSAPIAVKIQPALEARAAYRARFQELASDPGTRAKLQQAYASLPPGGKAEHAPVHRELAAAQTFDEFLAGPPQRTAAGTPITPQLIEHLLFPLRGPSGSGITGGHVDAKLHEFLRENPRYSVVERHQAVHGSITLRLYDQYYWDEKLNRQQPPPAPDAVDQRPRKGNDMSATWTRALLPKTTVDSLPQMLSLAEAEFVERCKQDPAILAEKRATFGMIDRAKPGPSEPGMFSGHLGWDKDQPFIRSLYLSSEWIQKHSQPQPEATGGLVPPK